MVYVLFAIISLLQPPQAGKPDGPLWRDIRTSIIEYEHRVCVDSFGSIGSHSPKWDKEAALFLESAAKFAADSKLVDAGRLTTRGQQVLRLGCDDPLVSALSASLTLARATGGAAIDQLQSCAVKLNDSKYSDYCKAIAWFRVGETITAAHGFDAARQAYSSAVALFISACSSPDQPKIPVRHALYRGLVFLSEDVPAEVMQDFCKRLEASNADAWLVHMFWAEYFSRLAWAARGTGFASTVTDEGWKEFAKNSEKERDHLEAAYAADPAHPEPCYRMMVVVRTGHAMPGQTLRTWFERGTKAQLDYVLLHERMIESLLPRWHGGYEEIEQFGMECAATERYDTRIPLQYVMSLLAIANDTGDYSTILRRPGTFDKCRDVLMGYVKAEPQSASWYRSLLAGLAWHAGRFEELQPMLSELKGQLDDEALQRARVVKYQLVDDAVLYRGATGQLLRQADVAASKKEWGRSRELCEEALDKCPAEDRLTMFSLSNRVFLSRFAESFETGRATELKFEVGTPGWVAMFGNWIRVSDTAIRARPGPDGLRMNFQYPVGLRFELTGQVDFSAVSDPGVANAGFAFGYETLSNSSPRYFGLTFFPGTNSVGVSRGWPTAGDKKTPELSGSVAFTISCFDDDITITVKGVQVYRGPLPKRGSWNPGDGFAIGGRSNRTNGGIEFSHLVIRKLSELPANQDAKPRF